MKKAIIILILAACTSVLNGQILSGIGVKAGIGISNHSWVYSHGTELTFDNKTGLSARVFADFFNFEFFQVEGEIGYIRKGFTDKIPFATTLQPDGTGEYINFNISLDYLTFSTLAKFKYETKYVTPYIIAGPQIDILVNKDVHDAWKVIYDKFKNTNIGFSVGAGAELKFNLPASLLLEYRFEKDFGNNYDAPYIEIKNYSHVVLVGVKF